MQLGFWALCKWQGNARCSSTFLTGRSRLPISLKNPQTVDSQDQAQDAKTKTWKTTLYMGKILSERPWIAGWRWPEKGSFRWRYIFAEFLPLYVCSLCFVGGQVDIRCDTSFHGSTFRKFWHLSKRKTSRTLIVWKYFAPTNGSEGRIETEATEAKWHPVTNKMNKHVKICQALINSTPH